MKPYRCINIPYQHFPSAAYLDASNLFKHLHSVNTCNFMIDSRSHLSWLIIIDQALISRFLTIYLLDRNEYPIIIGVAVFIN